MKLLLLGEYSNVHATLARGLRALGHEVTVASNGDFWKNYPRDTDLARKPGKWGGITLQLKVWRELFRWRDYDVVQLINPMFLELRAERIFPIYDYLRRNNRRIILGGFGMDWYWAHTCVEEKPLRYSDFNIGDQLRDNPEALTERKDWIGTAKEALNKHIANSCDAIVAGLYEYWVCYSHALPDKTVYIPYPIEMPQPHEDNFNGLLRVFIGINSSRSAYKGTDIMLSAAEEVAARHPDRMQLRVARSVPFNEYQQMMDGSDVILDQLYSYTPSMNALLAMSKGIICVGGGEPEHYDLLGETQLRPIINVQPSRESVVEALEWLIAHPDSIPQLKRDSIAYVRRHHDYLDVARKYERYASRCSGAKGVKSAYLFG